MPRNSRSRSTDQTNLDMCKAEKDDIRGEVVNLKTLLKAKNQEIGALKSKLISYEVEMSGLKNYIKSQISAMTDRLNQNFTHPFNPGQDDWYHCPNDQTTNMEESSILANHIDSSARTTVLVPVSLPPEPSSSPQSAKKLAPVSVINLNHEANEFPLVKKGRFECEAQSAGKLVDPTNLHRYGVIPGRPSTKSQRNKARVKRKKLMMTGKTQSEESLQPSFVDPGMQNSACPECGTLMFDISRGSEIGCLCLSSMNI